MQGQDPPALRKIETNLARAVLANRELPSDAQWSPPALLDLALNDISQRLGPDPGKRLAISTIGSEGLNAFMTLSLNRTIARSVHVLNHFFDFSLVQSGNLIW